MILPLSHAFGTSPKLHSLSETSVIPQAQL